MVSIQRTRRIFDKGYALSKRPHLHRAYVIRGCIFLWLAIDESKSYAFILKVTKIAAMAKMVKVAKVARIIRVVKMSKVGR